MRKLFLILALAVVASIESMASIDVTTAVYSEEYVQVTNGTNGNVLNKSDKLEELMDGAANTAVPFLTFGRARKPTDEEYALMRLMLKDSISIYYDYLMHKDLNEEDRKTIERWNRANKDVVDDMLIGDAIRLVSIESRQDFRYCPIDLIGHKILNDNFAERLNWRRMVAGRRKASNTNAFLDNWVEALRKDFGETQKEALPVKSIFLSYDNKRFIDALNFINGEDFIECEGFDLETAQLDRIKDWCWANKGKVSDKLFSQVYKLLYDRDMEFINEADYVKKESELKEMIEDLEIIVMLHWNNPMLIQRLGEQYRLNVTDTAIVLREKFNEE